MENSERELLFLSFLLLLTLFLSISLRLMSAQHPQRRGRQPERMQTRRGSVKRTHPPMNSSVLNSASVSNESANIVSKLLETGFRPFIQKLFPFYLRPWTRQESTYLGGLSLPWFLKPQILQNSKASYDLKEQATVSAESDERDDCLTVATGPFLNDGRYGNQNIKHCLTRLADPSGDLLSGFSSMDVKLSIRSQDLSWHELTLSSKVHRAAGSPDLLRKFLRGAEKVFEVAITKGGGKFLVESEETSRMMSCLWNYILNEVPMAVPSSPKAMAILIVNREDRSVDPESREICKNASKTLLYVDLDSSDASGVVSMKIFVCPPPKNGLDKINHSTPSRPSAHLLSSHTIKHD